MDKYRENGRRMKPGKVNEILARVDFHKMARWFWDRHRGYPFRVKTRDICVVFLNHLTGSMATSMIEQPERP